MSSFILCRLLFISLLELSLKDFPFGPFTLNLRGIFFFLLALRRGLRLRLTGLILFLTGLRLRCFFRGFLPLMVVFLEGQVLH